MFPLAKSPLFDYGTDKIKVDENNKHHINLRLQSAGLQFPFYGTKYDDLYSLDWGSNVKAKDFLPYFDTFLSIAVLISKDGMIGFTEDIRYSNVDPGSTKILRVDLPFIAPFRYDGLGLGETLANGNAYSGHIYYKVLTGDMNEELKNISEIIRYSVVGASEFNASWGLVVTWKDVVSRADAQNCPSVQIPCPTNTFQAVVSTDGESTYAIFNYEKMDIGPPTKFQAGFNAGWGRGWTEIMQPSKLANANNQSGRPLEIYPNYAGMLGGSMIEFSGLCLRPTDHIMCKFGSGSMAQTSVGHYINKMKGRCAVPTLSEIGLIQMSVSIDGGNRYDRSTSITIGKDLKFFFRLKNKLENFLASLLLKQLKVFIVLEDSLHNGYALPARTHQYIKTSDDWLTLSPSILTVTWGNTSLLSSSKNAQININLVGYRETQNEVEYSEILTLLHIKWQRLTTLGKNISLEDKSYSFDASSYGCRDDFCGLYDIGFLEVSLVEENKANLYRAFNSKFMPLGWYNNRNMVDKYGDNWPSKKCSSWYEKDSLSTKWKENMINCPCNLKQAIIDIGRFQAATGCNMFESNKCKYHEGSVHCVRSVQHTDEGAGNQCCYDKDGLLRYAADTFKGSSSDRGHDFGAYPYKSFGKVPQASHWVHDIAPLFDCCIWTDFKDCDMYMDLRPTIGCSGYKAPSAAAIYGQGHVTTLMGEKFRMCNEGDFILLQGQNFKVQGRFQFSANLGPHQKQSVVFTHVAVKTNEETIEIRLRHPSLDKSGTLLDVLVNDKYTYFKTKSMMWQDFKFLIPQSLKDSVNGILAHLGSNTNHDHSHMEADKIISADMAWNFQNKCGKYGGVGGIRNQQESIIKYAIFPDNTTNLCSETLDPTTNEHYCDNNSECKTDIRITGDVQAALYTKEASFWISATRSILENPVRTCGYIDIPRSTKSSYNYTLGSTVEITGCRKGSLKGPTTYTCEATSDNEQMWNPSVTATCLCKYRAHNITGAVEQANVGMIVVIVIAVVVLLIIIIAIVCCIKRRGKSEKRDVAKPEERNYDASYSEVKKQEEP
ncbi:hypothetical protein KUTeg_011222 [Tegillarca granosa]|uniref:AMOP domain-containing protein n=1 Tax=Tegillarca granosa TaxID=220873 RepID=A0ABQ9F1F7_TEGGR|nr:hypothetical protein KUTeg_011222 [Tegillarca granosa]